MLTTPLAFAFVLGVLVFVHELGHFLVARWHGVRVLTFSLGFGPKLFGFRRGDTEYALSLIPLGGYVKMAGENPEDNPQGAADEFMSKSKWQRFQVLLAGPAMNMILAVVLLALVLMQGDRVLAYLSKPAVIGVVAEGSAAATAGITAGDEVVRINGRAISTWEELDMAVSSKPGLDVEMTLRKNGEVVATGAGALRQADDTKQLQCDLGHARRHRRHRKHRAGGRNAHPQPSRSRRCPARHEALQAHEPRDEAGRHVRPQRRPVGA